MTGAKESSLEHFIHAELFNMGLSTLVRQHSTCRGSPYIVVGCLISKRSGKYVLHTLLQQIDEYLCLKMLPKRSAICMLIEATGISTKEVGPSICQHHRSSKGREIEVTTDAVCHHKARVRKMTDWTHRGATEGSQLKLKMEATSFSEIADLVEGEMV